MELQGGDLRGVRDDCVIRSWMMTFTENSGVGDEESHVSGQEPRVQFRFIGSQESENQWWCPVGFAAVRSLRRDLHLVYLGV